MADQASTPRALHWVFKITNLKESIAFYSSVLQMKVQRHEEFNSGCEATCNGPYQRPWSKTMIGPGNEDDFFVFELTYNYGITKYNKGNDLRYIAIKDQPGLRERAAEQKFKLDGDFLVDADGFRWKICADEGSNPVLYVSLNVSDLEKSTNYYVKVLGMQLFESGKEADGSPNALVGFAASQTKLKLVEEVASKGQKIDQGTAGGRIAFGSPDIQVQYKSVVASENKVIHHPVVLDTPGKKSVEVVIVEDVDGYEICFVEDEGFRDLSKPAPGAEKIDWEARAELGADQTPRK